MSPTIFREGPYRFFFFSREETRMHVHVTKAGGNAKFWIEPIVALADYDGLKAHELKELERLVRDHYDEIKEAWQKYFKTSSR